MNTLPFHGPLTDELFNAWLDERPERRAAHERLAPEKRDQERARVARLFALRASAVAADLGAVAELARVLRDAARGFADRCDVEDAAAALAAAGLEVPGPHDIAQEYGADTFNESIFACHKLAKRLDKFLALLDSEVRFILPTSPESVQGAAA